jgi:hypothetical protein
MPVSTLLQHAYQDACGIGYGAFSALGWAESRFGIDFFVVFFSIVIISYIIVSLDAPPSLSSRHHLYRRANFCLITPLSHLTQRLVDTFLLSSSSSLPS